MVKFFQKQINIFLVLFLVTAIVVTIGLSTFYQNMFRNMTAKYDALSEDYALTSNELDFYKSEYTRSLNNLNTTEQDVVKIGELFESSEGQIESLKSELRETTIKLESTEKDLKETAESLRQKNTEIATKNLQYNSLTIKYNALERDYNDLRTAATQMKILCGVKCDDILIDT